MHTSYGPLQASMSSTEEVYYKDQYASINGPNLVTTYQKPEKIWQKTENPVKIYRKSL